MVKVKKGGSSNNDSANNAKKEELKFDFSNRYDVPKINFSTRDEFFKTHAEDELANKFQPLQSWPVQDDQFAMNIDVNLDHVRTSIECQKYMSLNFISNEIESGEIERSDFPTSQMKISRKHKDIKAYDKYNFFKYMSKKFYKEELYDKRRKLNLKINKLNEEPKTIIVSQNQDIKKVPVESDFIEALKAESVENCIAFKNISRLQICQDSKIDVEEEKNLSRERVNSAIKRVFDSAEVREILISNLLSYPNSGHGLAQPGLVKIFCQTLKTAIFKHDWTLASKCCEYLSINYNTPGTNTTALYNAGFLVLINMCKNNLGALENLLVMNRELLSLYPRRVGIDLVSWFTLKGFFVPGLNILEKIHSEANYTSIYTTGSLKNVRKNKIDFVADLFRAVHQYSVYKVKKKDGEDDGEMILRDSTWKDGALALALFKELLKSGSSFEDNSTMFINQMIEVAIDIKGACEAKKLFETVLKNNLNNGVLNSLYLHFIKKHFMMETQLIEDLEKAQELYQFKNSYQLIVTRKSSFKNLLKRKTRIYNFKKIEAPNFCW